MKLDDPDRRRVQHLADLILVIHPMERAYAIDELGHMSAATGEAVPALIEALRDTNSDVRAAAVRALGDIGPAAGKAVPPSSRPSVTRTLMCAPPPSGRLGRSAWPLRGRSHPHRGPP